MFPNIRLLIGTLFIALLVLSCEFGVFATLRVNREPLNRLTSESAPLRLVAGNNASRPVPISWSPSLNVPAPAIDTSAGIAIVGVPAAQQPAERAIETPAPSNDGVAGALNNDTLNSDNQASHAAAQTALAPSPAAPVPIAAVANDVAAPIAQAPVPPPANAAAPIDVATPANADASVAPAQEIPAPAVSSDAANGPPAQPAAAPAAIAAVPEQQTPAADVAKPAEAEPPQAVPAHETAAQAGEPPPAGGAPVLAAIAPGAAEPPAAPPAEITGSVPNAAAPETATPQAAAPQAKAPHAKPLPKIVRKPAAKKPHKVAHAPPQPRHPVKKRIARRGHAPAASSAQAANTFENPVFQSAPEFQRPTRRRAGAKTTATNTGFSNTFGAQLSPQ